jgi:hypothetical protein
MADPHYIHWDGDARLEEPFREILTNSCLGTWSTPLSNVHEVPARPLLQRKSQKSARETDDQTREPECADQAKSREVNRGEVRADRGRVSKLSKLTADLLKVE